MKKAQLYTAILWAVMMLVISLMLTFGDLKEYVILVLIGASGFQFNILYYLTRKLNEKEKFSSEEY